MEFDFKVCVNIIFGIILTEDEADLILKMIGVEYETQSEKSKLDYYTSVFAKSYCYEVKKGMMVYYFSHINKFYLSVQSFGYYSDEMPDEYFFSRDIPSPDIIKPIEDIKKELGLGGKISFHTVFKTK